MKTKATPAANQNTFFLHDAQQEIMRFQGSGVSFGLRTAPRIPYIACLVITILCFLIFFPSAGLTTSTYASRTLSIPYTHYAEQAPLTDVLANFARSQHMSAAFSAGVQGTVSGRFTAIPPSQFLAGMRAAFGVTYYQLGSTLYFYNENEVSRIFITPKSMDATRLFTMLTESDVLAPQLPAEMLPQGDMILLSGPPAYLEQVSRAVTAFEHAQITNFGMRVFPLKYAWAEDISVNSMDKTITVPGVASILRAMVSGSPTSATQITQQKATVDKLGGTGLIAQGQQHPITGMSASSAPEQPVQTQAQPTSAVSIIADPRVNAVLVQDALYRMPYYKDIIKDLDKPVELVEIHAAIVDIDVDYSRSLGVTYQGAKNPGDNGWGGGGELTPGDSSFTPLPELGKLGGAGLSLSTIYTHGSDYFLARVNALEEDGEARMLGRPSVLTVDNVEATLENTTSYYIEVAGDQAVDLFKVEAGTVLRVTPHIIRDNGSVSSIKLAVNVQDNQNDTDKSTATNTGLPPIKQTKINTQAIVGAGQSLLIGGYYYEQKVDGTSGIPLLKNIPVLGHLFKTTTKGTKRMERLILITPRVIKLDEIPEPPTRVDEPSFRQSPTQNTYEERTPLPTPPQRGGCSRSPHIPASPSLEEGNASRGAPPPLSRLSIIPTMPSHTETALSFSTPTPRWDLLLIRQGSLC